MTIGVVGQFVMPTSIAFVIAFVTDMKEGEIIDELLSVYRVTAKLSGNRQGERIRRAVGALDVLTDR